MNLTGEALRGILLPFWGTAAGALSVLVLRRGLNSLPERMISGFAAGVMGAASVWSLLLPALEQADRLGCWAFVPAVTGVWAGVVFLLGLEVLVPPCGTSESTQGRLLTALAVTLHNVPEGMAVGVAYAALLGGVSGMTAAGALTISAGIALQNVPEGAIISLPLRAQGMGRGQALLWGVLSGAVEPVAAVLTVLCAAWITPALPGLLGFAAGAMLCAVVEELVPAMMAGERSALPTLACALGFTLMLALDVGLG